MPINIAAVVAAVVAADSAAIGGSSEWLVVGGGPLGTIAVATLLRSGAKGICWVDPQFEQMGRIGERYESVPSNTRNDLLVRAFRSLPALNFDIAQQQRRRQSPTHRSAVLSDAAPHGYLPLASSIDALRDGSAALRRDSRVTSHCGTVTSLTGEESAPIRWHARLRLNSAHTDIDIGARQVILATGAAPREPPARVVRLLEENGVSLLSHDDAICPSRLRALLSADADFAASLAGARVAVVGGSHSGVLAAKNAIELADAGAVDIYRRGAVRLADERDGWMKFDGTGLKGEVRDWMVRQQRAQRQLEGADEGFGTGRLPSQPDGEAAAQESALRMDRVRVHTDAPDTGDVSVDEAVLVERILASGATWLVWTTGFERRRAPESGAAATETPLPSVHWNGRFIDLPSTDYDARTTNAIVDARGLYGVGLGYPAIALDPEGLEERWVGFGGDAIKLVERIAGDTVTDDAQERERPSTIHSRA